MQPLAGKNIAICIPSYDAKITTQMASSLYVLFDLIKSHGGMVSFFVQNYTPIIPIARNLLILEVMNNPTVTGMFMMDSDISFQPYEALAMIAKGLSHDIVVALYRKKQEEIGYFATFMEDEAGDVIVKDGLLQASRVPVGFAYINRNVIQRLWDDSNHRIVNPGKVGEYRAIFDNEYRNGDYIGEDYVFCDKIKAAGFDILVMPEVDLTHYGTKGYAGSYRASSEELNARIK